MSLSDQPTPIDGPIKSHLCVCKALCALLPLNHVERRRSDHDRLPATARRMLVVLKREYVQSHKDQMQQIDSKRREIDSREEMKMSFLFIPSTFLILKSSNDS